MAWIRFTCLIQFVTKKVLDVEITATHPIPQMKQKMTIVAYAPVHVPKDTLQ